jgi:hypothetical protein
LPLRLLPLVAALLLSALPAARAFVHQRVPIEIPMRDGKTLAADAYLPDTAGSWPVILIQTPYNKNIFALIFRFETSRDPLLKSPDYAFVVLDWRGFFGSADADYPGSPSRGEDGYDAVEWIAAQSWCTGAVGSWGASALGIAQLLTAAQQPPHLRACVPMVYHYKERYGLAYPGGVYYRNRNEFVYGLFGGKNLIRAHPLYDAFWSATEDATGDPSRIDLPMLHVTGWYDHETAFTIADMLAIQEQGGPGARGRQKLIIGPWSHSHVDDLQQGELQFPDAEFASSRAALRLFDFYLRGIENGWENDPAVQYYVVNQGWRTAETWPPPGSFLDRRFLAVRGVISTSVPENDGVLSFPSDPDDPVPTLFGAVLTEEYATQGPGDLAPIEAREDVRNFTTAPLDQPLTITGAPVARLWITLGPVDADLAVRLTEAFPDGRSLLLVDSIRRVGLRRDYAARHRPDPAAPSSSRSSFPPSP